MQSPVLATFSPSAYICKTALRGTKQLGVNTFEVAESKPYRVRHYTVGECRKQHYIPIGRRCNVGLSIIRYDLLTRRAAIGTQPQFALATIAQRMLLVPSRVRDSLEYVAKRR